MKDLASKDLNLLVQNGMIVEDNINEWENANSIYEASQKDNVYRLTVNPTLNCNFRCWYCYETHHHGQKMGTEVLSNVKHLIHNLSINYPQIELSFFGGEPFMEFNSCIKPLIEYLKELRLTGTTYTVSFTTNGFLLNETIIKYLTTCNCGLFQITLDGGLESHNKTRVSKNADSFSKILNNVFSLLEHGLKVMLRINLTKSNSKSALQIAHYLKNLTDNQKQHLTISLQQVWQDKRVNDISNELWDIRKSFFDIGINCSSKYTDYIRNICYADKDNSAVINYNGDVFKCTAIDFDKETCDGKLDKNGQIVDNNHRFYSRNKNRKNKIKCRSCRIMPLCYGGCSQTVSKNSLDYCIYNDNEQLKDDVVMSIISEIIFNKQFQLQ